MPEEFLFIENKMELIKIPLHQILYFEKVKNTDNLCVAYDNGLAFFKSGLREVLAQVGENFIQCHKSFIVNIARVVRIEKFHTYLTLHFNSKASCPCSLLYKNEVIKKWKS